MSEAVSAFLAEKLAEYQVLSAPLERAHSEIDLSKQLLRARLEVEIEEHVPALAQIADILDFSVMDLLLSADRTQFVNQAMFKTGLSSDEVLRQLRSLGPPTPNEDLALLGLSS
jgi:hypothetical protein